MLAAAALALAIAGGSTGGATAECPPPALSTPRYPIEMLRRNVSGAVLVNARVDACGRVTEASVLDGSGHKALDEAAVASVRLWVFSEAQRSGVVDGWLKVPVSFGGVRTIVPKKVDWPRSHRRPLYLADDQPIGFATIAEFAEARPGRSEPLLASPYAAVLERSGRRTSTTFHQDREQASVYWLSYVVQVPAARDAPPGTGATVATRAVARYRLVQEQGQAAVRLAVLCEDTPEGCSQLRDFLMQGLPFAKAARK